MPKININKSEKIQLIEEFNLSSEQLEKELQIIAKKYDILTYSIAYNWYKVAEMLTKCCELEFTPIYDLQLG